MTSRLLRGPVLQPPPPPPSLSPGQRVCAAVRGVRPPESGRVHPLLPGSPTGFQYDQLQTGEDGLSVDQ